jgi:hypothetical protein
MKQIKYEMDGKVLYVRNCIVASFRVVCCKHPILESIKGREWKKGFLHE